ncbi:MAG: glycerophosphodiester phosphodiesterase [Fidelibacterota bacterium]
MIITICVVFTTCIVWTLVRLKQWSPNASKFYPEGRVILLSHRGYQRRAKENTIGAIKSALLYGADGVEVDVRQTKDKYLVLSHDAFFKDDNNKEMSIKLSNYYQILDHMKATCKDLNKDNMSIPLLEDIWTKIQQNKRINLEIKTDHIGYAGFEKEIVRLIKKYNSADRIIVSSFNLSVLQMVKKIDRHISTALLWDKRVYKIFWYLPIVVAFISKADAIHLHWKQVETKLMNACHKLGIKVSIWTVNNAAVLEQVLPLKIDGIITDETERIRKLI